MDIKLTAVGLSLRSNEKYSIHVGFPTASLRYTYYT